jgi:predicted Zn-dependent protease
LEGGQEPILNTRICAICGVSVASICLLPALVLGQTKRSKSDADINLIGHRNIAQGPNFYTPEKEKELGNKLALETEKSSRFIVDPSTTAFVERLAQNVERNSDKHMPIAIKLIDTEEAKAFTLPGGHQYITRGLLLRVESEGELASLLARGIAHTALRSSTKIATKAEMLQLSTIPVTSSVKGNAPNSGVPLAIPLVELKAKRDAELDADYFGVQYLFKSGYDPKCFLDFVARIGDANKTVPETFSEYPPLAQRLQALQKEIAEILPKRDGAVISTQEFQEFKNHLQAMRPEHAAPQNPTEDN